MTKFKNFLNEISTASATNMEQVIVDLWNGEKPKYEELVPAGKDIVNFLTKNVKIGKPVSTDANRVGGGKSGIKITDEWKKWGATDNTPKTDIIINGYQISLKQAGGSQLMSGKVEETTATIMTALKDVHLDTSGLVTSIEKILDKSILGQSELNVTQMRDSGKMPKDVANSTELHQSMTKALTDIFNKETKLKAAVVREAMTGRHKFGNDSIARAKYFLVFSPKSDGKHQWHEADDRSFIAEKTSKTKMHIYFKSGSYTSKAKGKIYTYYSAFRLSEEITRRINEEISKYEPHLLTEGVVSTIVDRVKSWFNNVWNRIKEWLLESMENVLTFFELEPEAEFGEIQF